jgi:hypothetical protein
VGRVEADVVVEMDALPDAKDVGEAVLRDLGHRLGQAGLHLEGPLQVLVLEQFLEDHGLGAVGVDVSDLGRVEALDVRRQDLVEDHPLLAGEGVAPAAAGP